MPNKNELTNSEMVKVPEPAFLEMAIEQFEEARGIAQRIAEDPEKIKALMDSERERKHRTELDENIITTAISLAIAYGIIDPDILKKEEALERLVQNCHMETTGEGGTLTLREVTLQPHSDLRLRFSIQHPIEMYVQRMTKRPEIKFIESCMQITRVSREPNQGDKKTQLVLQCTDGNIFQTNEEQDEHCILRLYETDGKKTTAYLFHKKGSLVSGLEEKTNYVHKEPKKITEIVNEMLEEEENVNLKSVFDKATKRTA